MTTHFTRGLLAADIATQCPDIDIGVIDEVLFRMFLVLQANRVPNTEWVADPAFYEINTHATRPDVRIVSSPGTATCHWCKRVHAIEQIKKCRWEATRIKPEVFEAAKIKALGTASKLKKDTHDHDREAGTLLQRGPD